MISLIINIMKLFIKKKSYILRGVILPAFVIIFFTFEFGNEYKFKVGIVNKDNSYASEEVIKVIDELEDVETVNINEKDYKMLLVSQQIQMAIIINNDFQEKLLNNDDNNIIIKSINESNVNAVIKNMIELKCEDLSMISNISNKDINNFKKFNENYKDEGTKLSLNDIDESRPQIEKSLGLIMVIVFIICENISNFLIEDEENKTKIRILSSGISKWKYYFFLVFVFYIMSFSTIFFYYLLCKIFSINFGMENSLYFLIVMMFLNLLAFSFNLCIVAFTRSRYTSTIVNILIIVPCCMLSGVFWNFNVMTGNFQRIGRFMPTRWVILSVETLQRTNNLQCISRYLYSLTLLSIVFFVITFIKLRTNKEI